jgi:drug/metabolite transporter (DMT)-like permease
MVFGAWLLHEPIEASFLIGAIPVLVGIVLVSGGGWVATIMRNNTKNLCIAAPNKEDKV